MLVERSFIFSPGSLRHDDVYRHESGRCRSLTFFLKYFYHFTFPGFPFIFTLTLVKSGNVWIRMYTIVVIKNIHLNRQRHWRVNSEVNLKSSRDQLLKNSKPTTVSDRLTMKKRCSKVLSIYSCIMLQTYSYNNLTYWQDFLILSLERRCWLHCTSCRMKVIRQHEWECLKGGRGEFIWD